MESEHRSHYGQDSIFEYADAKPSTLAIFQSPNSRFIGKLYSQVFQEPEEDKEAKVNSVMRLENNSIQSSRLSNH